MNDNAGQEESVGMTYRRSLVVAGPLAFVLALVAGDAVAETVDTTTAAFHEQTGKQLFEAERWPWV